MKSKWLRWAWILPVVEVALAGASAGIPASRILRIEFKARREKAVITVDPSIVIDMLANASSVRLQLLPDDGLSVSRRFEFISFVNLPGLFPSLLVDRFSRAWPEEWRPDWAYPLGMWGWRSISWPIFCLPFWWLAGRGIDAFITSLQNAKSKAIAWYEAWGMVFFGVAMIILGVGIAFSIDPHDDMPEMRWIVVPASMWFVLGIISLIAWIRQRRADRSNAEMSATAG